MSFDTDNPYGWPRVRMVSRRMDAVPSGDGASGACGRS